ncbi:uncharacterized protein LOC131544658 isoform X1 [Onychostoma macrolepis]|uniref:uncharacterized protein LOC131544658 isoform X1 n=1 Tax=Onychostoma macrolepis TaxID=369639 RepID=UPI00272A9D59|nr:uncharacterized protein LOC131544658 isoform X1 [Onychostoma macrolepis]
MDAAILLLALKQGTRSLEGYITEYLALANGSELPDYMLIDFFCEGINQPLKSRLTLEAPRSSLSDFIDYALVTVGSAFTVGVAEECDTAFNCMITDALEHAHKMAAATTPRHVTATIHEPSQVALDLQESSQVTADLHELNQVTVDVKESNQVTVAVKEPSEVTVDVRESSQATVDRHELSQATVDRHELSQSTTDRHEPRQVTIDLHESSQDTADLHESSQDKADFHELSQVTASLRESSQVAADLHESSQVKADLHESSQVKADLQEPSQVAVDVRESSQVTVGRHQPSHVSADHPESLHVSADLLKSSHVTAVRPESQHHVPADLPESGHVRADTPRSSRSVFHYSSLISSLRDSPLVSARTAGIPKPTHSSPPVPELIPLSEVLPMMGIALCCVWAAYTTAALSEVATAATASPEVVAHAAELPEAAGLTSAPCMVVALSNVLSTCCVAVEKTITKLSLCPEFTAVEPPEVAAAAAEPPEVSAVSIGELSLSPVTAMEAVNELSFCPVTAMKAVNELSFCPVTAIEAVYELSVLPASVLGSVHVLSPFYVSVLSRSQALLWVPDPPWWAPALSVTNPVCALPFIHHQRSLTHHIDFHTTHHNGLRFPSAISPITCSPDHTHTAVTNHTLYLNPVLSLPRRRVLYALSLPYRAPLVFLALPSLALPLSDCVFPCLDYRSRCWITSPVLPLWILFADRRPTLVFVYSLSRPCYTCLPLFDPAC